MCIRDSLSAKGQTTIPARVRRALDVRPGDTIWYDMGDDGVRIRKTTPLDMEWASAVEATLTEWMGEDDDDL